MATLIARTKSMAKQMLDDKKEIEKYIQHPDANPKPVGVKFVKPVTLPVTGK